MDTGMFVPVLAAMIGVTGTILVTVSVGIYRVLTSLKTGQRQINQSLFGNQKVEQDDGLVGRLEKMKNARKQEHAEVQTRLESVEKHQENLIDAIETSDKLDLDVNVGSNQSNYDKDS